jgi:hypothetical protein
MMASDMSIPLDFTKRLYDRLRPELTNVTAIKTTVEWLARTFPEVRFCKACVLPIVNEVANLFLAERFDASRQDVFRALRCEGFKNLSQFYEISDTRTRSCGSPANRDKQTLSKSRGQTNSGASPDFCIWYSSTHGQLRMVGEAKYPASQRSSQPAVRDVLADLRYYLAIKSCSHSAWAHDFGFGVVYCAGGDQPGMPNCCLTTGNRITS